MSGNNSQPGHSKRWFLFTISAAIVLFDRWTKWAIVKHVSMYDGVVVIPGFFQLTHTENPGTAFDILRYSTASWKQPLLIGLSLLATCIVVAILWRNSRKFDLANVGLAMILGGAMGNLWDRMFSGRVVDFLEFFLGSQHWPVFNIADSSIVTGATLLALKVLFTKQNPRAESVSN